MSSSQHLHFGSEAPLPYDHYCGLPLLPNSAFSSNFSSLPLPPPSSFSASIDSFHTNANIFHNHYQTHQEYESLLVSPASPLSSQYSEHEEEMSSTALLPEGGPLLTQTYSSQTTCSASSGGFDSDPSQPSDHLMPGSPSSTSSSSDASSYLDSLPSFELPPLPGVSTILERSASATSVTSLPLPIPLSSLNVEAAGRTSRDLSPLTFPNGGFTVGYSAPYLSPTVTAPQGYSSAPAYGPVSPAASTPSPVASASPAPNPYHPYALRQKKRERPQPEQENVEVNKTHSTSSRAHSKSSNSHHRAESKRPVYNAPLGFPALCPFVEINDGVGVSGFNGACPLNDHFVSLSHREWAAMDENANQSRRSAKCRMRVTITIPPSQSQPAAEITLALCLNHGGGAAAKDRKYDAAFLTLPTMGPNGQPSYAVIRSRPEKRRSVWIVGAGEAAKFKHTVPSAMSLDQRGEYGLWFYNLPEGVEDHQVNVEVGTIAGCRARELAVEPNPSKKQKPSKLR